MGIRKYSNFINGTFDDSGIESYLPVANPATESVISEIPMTSLCKLDDAIASSRAAQKEWAKLKPIVRAGYLHKISGAIRKKADYLANIISEEQGKVLPLAKVEVGFTADYIDYTAEWARRIEGEIIESDRPGENIFLFRKPLGVVGGILPWNFPFFLIARKLAPAFVTGNTIVIKPSIETPNNAFEFAKIIAELDLPKGIVQIIGGRGGKVGSHIASHPSIDMISFTGSVETGVKIMEAASKNVTKVNLELGGKAPAIVMDDADLEIAATAITASRIINSGQVCNCAERAYVHEKVYDEFIEKIKVKMSNCKCGDPLKEENLDYGPMVNRPTMDKVHEMVQNAKNSGAELLCGGNVIDRGKGHYYEPTILTNCEQNSEIIQKEVFGPVLPVKKIGSLEEGIECANDSEYGLTSSLYTKSLSNAMKACNEIDFGETYINRENFEAMQGFHAGTRKSGIGGADGKHGLYEFTRTHVVYIQN